MIEYYVYVTKNCNLKCDYCDGVNLNRDENSNENEIDVNSIANFIRKDINTNQKEDDYGLIFYGGEPLLNQEAIIKLMRILLDYNITYILHTNGTLLNRIHDYILKNVDYIFISIDGDRTIHDRHRGKGTYDKIMKNVSIIKNNFNGELVARMTVTLDLPLYPSVMSLTNSYDHIYWQIENSPNYVPQEKLANFKDSYIRDLNRLADIWINNLKNGKMLNLIPFQDMTYSLLTGKNEKFFRCGASGYQLTFIDINGDCYVCDKLIGNNKFLKGNIHKGVTHENKFICSELNNDCKNCNIRHICGGRCLAQVLFYPKTKFKFYCDTVKALKEKMIETLPAIQDLIKNDQFELEDFHNHSIAFYERFP